MDDGFACDHNRHFYNALRTQIWEDIRTSTLTWHISAGGTILDLCSGPVTVAGGLEYRGEELINSQDQNSKFGNITSNNFSPAQLTTSPPSIHSVFVDVQLALPCAKCSRPCARE